MFKEVVRRFVYPCALIVAGMLQLLNVQYAAADARPSRVKKNSYIVVVPDSESVRSRKLQAPRKVTGFQGESLGSGRQIRYERSNSSSSLRGLQQNEEFVDYNPADDTCQRLIEEFEGAASCSPDFEVYATKNADDTTPWGVASINSERAWDRTTGSSDTIVAVLDTGVDYKHTDLAANMWNNPGEIPGNGIDDDHNGIVDDVHGMNAITGSGDPMDDNGHGTHVAGTIGAVGNNGTGVTGVNWTVRIIALKFLNSSGSGSLSGAIKGMNYLLDLKDRGINVRAVNNSWGGGGFSQPLYDVFKRAGEVGIVLAIAAGNESNDNDANPTYPASMDLPNIISVAAIDRDANVASFSNFGASSVDIAAPGVSIASLAPGNREATMSGTSMATPHVTGALALLASSEPSLSGTQLISRLYDSATSVSSLAGMVRTGRMLDVGRAVMGEGSSAPSNPVQTCSYDVSQVTFAPDRSAESAKVAIRGDELEFKTVPFAFNFFGNQAKSAVLSLNGVVYAGKTPEEMDFRNFSRAASNSIAALHTDLVGNAPPYGVRYKISSDGSKLAVYWLMHHYSSPTSGNVRAWAQIANTGEIVTCTSVDTSIAAAVAKSSTFGISPQSQGNGLTVSYNSESAPTGICIRYSPQCPSQSPTPGSGTATISHVKISPITSGSTISAGRKVVIRGKGVGNGTATLAAGINGHLCPNTKELSVKSGRTRSYARVPSSLDNRARTRVTFKVDHGKASRYIYGRSVRRSSSSPGRRLSASQLLKLCQSLMGSVR